MSVKRTGIFGLVALAALPATAQDVGSGPTELGEIRVQGAAPAPESRRSDLAFPTTGFGREVIEEVPDRRLGGALQRLPGVTMSGAPGERKDVRLRAIDKKFSRASTDGENDARALLPTQPLWSRPDSTSPGRRGGPPRDQGVIHPGLPVRSGAIQSCLGEQKRGRRPDAIR